MNGKIISLIIPCYNELESLPYLYQEIKKTVDALIDYQFEILFIDDGSVDQTGKWIMELAKEDKKVQYYIFSRNFGKEAAMFAGLCNAKGDYVAVMDADMQDPPSLLPKMLDILNNGGTYDCIATRRVDRRGEPPVRSIFAKLFYRIMQQISDANIVDGARDFRLMNRNMVDAVLSLGEYNRFSKGIFGWVGFKTYWLDYENQERIAGKTKWNFFKLLKYSIDGIINFSQIPLSFASWSGVILTFFSFFLILFIIIRKIIFGDPVAGWASLVCIITFMGGIQLFCMGIMGQYLAKTYMEVKKRPHFIIASTNKEDAIRIN